MATAATQLQSRDQLTQRLSDSRAVTDQLFRVVRKEALYDRPIAERHRIVFYIGHLEAFDWNLVGGQTLDLGAIHPEFDRLFAFGIDPVGGGLPTDQPSDWPRLGEIEAYNHQVRRRLDQILSDGPASGWKYPREVVLNVAIEHRLMHAETLAYMFHQLPYDRKAAPPDYRSIYSSQVAGPAITPRMLDIPAGTATLGLARGGSPFGWDNEFELQPVEVPAFAVDAYKVTNGDFLQFVDAGGYEDGTLWSEADWAWINEQDVAHPSFWRERGGQWFYRGMFEELPLPLDWPVYVSYAEAAAYARFTGKALPTEAEFHRFAYGTPEGPERAYPWGDAPPTESQGNFDFHRWDPAAVGSYPCGRSAFGAEDTLGNGWEWTASQFAPLPGFEPFPFYRGYSANFFDGQHYVIKGASPRTAACMLRRSFRNWFQPHYPYVYASFRCVSR